MTFIVHGPDSPVTKALSTAIKSAVSDTTQAAVEQKSLGEKLCEASRPYRMSWGALTPASQSAYEKTALAFAANLSHDETASAVIATQAERIKELEGERRRHTEHMADFDRRYSMDSSSDVAAALYCAQRLLSGQPAAPSLPADVVACGSAECLANCDEGRVHAKCSTSAKKTMTLTLTDEEMAALEEIASAKDMTPRTIFRHALKVFQLEARGMAKVTFPEGNRQADLASSAYPVSAPPPAVAEQTDREG
ncbi:hypothetical protein [Caulobacter sp. FWC2]|uniref:hypothetical protein n=1 Tax=Caulobacter sp. FWC2 TaxID=69664 RepID=UPI000C158D77|nr:hypothetical protein [Caulobacter sp. FWC2]PIB91246.1 hypothetical protein CSW62_06450 [Caulobacter sp. FWC2]